MADHNRRRRDIHDYQKRDRREKRKGEGRQVESQQGDGEGVNQQPGKEGPGRSCKQVRVISRFLQAFRFGVPKMRVRAGMCEAQEVERLFGPLS